MKIVTIRIAGSNRSFAQGEVVREFKTDDDREFAEIKITEEKTEIGQVIK